MNNKQKLKEALRLVLEVKVTLDVDTKQCPTCQADIRTHQSQIQHDAFNMLCDVQDRLHRLSSWDLKHLGRSK